jgi:hypothetical protein
LAKTPTQPGKGWINNVWEEPNLGTTVAIEPGYQTGTCLVMPENSFCMVPWMPKLYYEAERPQNFDSYTGGYGTIGDNVYSGMEYQIFGWNQQSDTSGGGGSTGSNGYAQSQTQNWQIGFTVAFVPAYLSNSGETAIYQFALMP